MTPRFKFTSVKIFFGFFVRQPLFHQYSTRMSSAIANALSQIDAEPIDSAVPAVAPASEVSGGSGATKFDFDMPKNWVRPSALLKAKRDALRKQAKESGQAVKRKAVAYEAPSDSESDSSTDDEDRYRSYKQHRAPVEYQYVPMPKSKKARRKPDYTIGRHEAATRYAMLKASGVKIPRVQNHDVKRPASARSILIGKILKEHNATCAPEDRWGLVDAQAYIDMKGLCPKKSAST